MDAAIWKERTLVRAWGMRRTMFLFPANEFNRKIQNLGGKIIIPKTPIPNMGAFAVGLDPEGNPVGIFEST